MAAAWREALLLVLAAGLARAGHHFVRLAILAALGLAGLYMLHTLAQDYNKIANRPRPAAVATRALFKALTKRHVGQQPTASRPAQESPVGPVGRALRRVLMQDPLGCARKLVCQLSSEDSEDGDGGRGGLRPHEVAILRLVRRAEEDGDEAAAEFRAAEELGRSDPKRCALRYSQCGLEARAVLGLLQALQAVG